MQIVIKISDATAKRDAHLFYQSSNDRFFTEEEKKSLENAHNTICSLENIYKIGYRISPNAPIISIEKKDGRLYVEIDEQKVISVEKRG